MRLHHYSYAGGEWLCWLIGQRDHESATIDTRPGDIQRCGGAEYPAALLRAACDLEILIPARDEVRRLPHTLMHKVRYLEAQPYRRLSWRSTTAASARHLIWLPGHGPTECQCSLPAAPSLERAPQYGADFTSRASFIGYMDADLATPSKRSPLSCRCLMNSRPSSARDASVARHLPSGSPLTVPSVA